MAGRRIILIELFMLLASGCSADVDREAYRITGSSMGTGFSIEIVDDPSRDGRTELEQDVLSTLQTINQRLSTYLPASELSQLNASQSQEWLPISAPLCNVLLRAKSLSARTTGAFDVTLGQLVNLWGFGPTASISKPPLASDIENALQSSGDELLEIDCSKLALRKRKPGLLIDLSAYAKGYAVDELATLLQRRGIENFLIEIGGELRARGRNASAKPWGIAIERPSTSGRAVHAVLRLTEPASVATSGDYRNYFEHNGHRYSHTINPETGWPVSHSAVSVTVVANSAADADALATALLVLGPEHGLAFAEREDVAAYFLLSNGDELTEIYSSHLPRRVTLDAL